MKCRLQCGLSGAAVCAWQRLSAPLPPTASPLSSSGIHQPLTFSLARRSRLNAFLFTLLTQRQQCPHLTFLVAYRRDKAGGFGNAYLVMVCALVSIMLMYVYGTHRAVTVYATGPRVDVVGM